MSVPRNTPPVPSYSSSPSKSSLRRTSGSHNPSTRSLLPSPHFDEAHASESRGSPRPDESLPAVEASHTAEDAGLPLQHLFQPFFTLIEDSTTHEHFHPTVHYIFADDDADIITEAALRSIEQNQLAPDESQASASGPKPQAEPEEHTPASRYLPHAKDGVREHYIVLDIERPPPIAQGPAGSAEAPQPGTSSGSNTLRQSQTGFEVVNAYSMSADWQVMRTGIGKAPTMAEDEDEGLMLRIEGRSGTPPEAKVVGETMEDMIERFERGLEDVKLVMEANRRAEGVLEGAGEEPLP
jgi:hypothetical protein